MSKKLALRMVEAKRLRQQQQRRRPRMSLDEAQRLHTQHMRAAIDKLQMGWRGQAAARGQLFVGQITH